MDWCFGKALKKRLRRIEDELRRIRFLVSRPRWVGILVVGECDMAIKFEVVLPEPPVAARDWNEVASGELTVTIGEGGPITILTTKDLQEGEPRNVTDERFIGPQGTMVKLEFSYIDDAGNKGASVTATQELLDTVPPVSPTSIGLVATEEVSD